MSIPEFHSATSNASDAFELRTSLDDDSAEGEYARFSDLAAKLVAVPKSEIDEQRR